MARRRRERSPSNIKLKQPDRAGPTEQTLLELADARGLFEQAKKKEDANKKKKAIQKKSTAQSDDEEGDFELSPTAERILETLLWAVSLTMLHFTLDVLVLHQYSADRILWPKVCTRAGQALLVFGMLVYTLHPHASSPTLIPGLPARVQSAVRQAVFFVTSICAGCYLIYITNMFGYLAVMKQAPPLGCLWVWSVIELDLPWAVLSLACDGFFLWWRGYDIK
ncbi:hypothetical protein B0H66DRAFT_358710 [Apodospora peruviana]|uniref:DUF7719 domain-containing protein n=1 Tax=Apodospora peruviana TaxID=516989 RepID=A0AAE0LZJ1_9PEZI|nr:hypothetical protein B0H66DRAFT_358710 [Apodospora peruviana]